MKGGRSDEEGGETRTHDGEPILVNFSGQLEMHTTEDRSLLSVNGHRTGDLVTSNEGRRERREKEESEQRVRELRPEREKERFEKEGKS